MFLVAVTLFSCNTWKLVSMNNQECKARVEAININDPYAEVCVPDLVKGVNVKVFNLVSSTNETRCIG